MTDLAPQRVQQPAGPITSYFDINVDDGAVDPLYGTSLLGPNFHPDTLTADSLFAYLTARLGNLDNRIDEIFKRQQKADAVRSALREISTELSRLHENADNPNAMDGEVHKDDAGGKATTTKVKEGVYDEINAALETLESLDTELYERVHAALTKEDGLLNQLKTNNDYNGQAVKAAKELVGNISKDLDASAQLDMIQLQSLTSARQTAIGLATNLLSSLSETLRSIAANIGK